MSENKGNVIKGKYFCDQSVKPESISGANATITPNGKFLLSLFDEIPSPPESYELEIDENGTVISQKISLDDQIVLARYFKFFAVMDLPTAKAIAELISSQIAEAEVQSNELN